MTSEKLANVRQYIVENVFRDVQVMYSEDRDHCDLPEIIASLYELLHREVEGEPYEYMFHWANKVGAWVEDDLFTKEVKDE